MLHFSLFAVRSVPPPPLYIITLTPHSQLVRAIEHLKIAAEQPVYPLKASAQASLALALAHSRSIPAAIDACRVALTLDSRNDHAASLWILLVSVLEPADDVMEVAISLKSQLPNSMLVHFVIAGLQVDKDTSFKKMLSLFDVFMTSAGSFGAQ